MFRGTQLGTAALAAVIAAGFTGCGAHGTHATTQPRAAPKPVAQSSQAGLPWESAAEGDQRIMVACLAQSVTGPGGNFWDACTGDDARAFEQATTQTLALLKSNRTANSSCRRSAAQVATAVERTRDALRVESNAEQVGIHDLANHRDYHGRPLGPLGDHTRNLTTKNTDFVDSHARALRPAC